MACIELKSKVLATHGNTPTEAEPNFRKVSLPPAKLRMHFCLLLKILASTKMGRAESSTF